MVGAMASAKRENGRPKANTHAQAHLNLRAYFVVNRPDKKGQNYTSNFHLDKNYVRQYFFVTAKQQ